MASDDHRSVGNVDLPQFEPGYEPPAPDPTLFDEEVQHHAQGGPFAPFDVVGPDDRQPVERVDRYPWRAICHLEVLTENGGSFPATGWLAGPRTVITAGHVVYPRGGSAYARTITVSAGREAAGSYHQPVEARIFRTTKGWADHNRSTADYGAILLPSPLPPIGDSTGYFGFVSSSDDALRGRTAWIAGYPEESGGISYFHKGRIEDVEPRLLIYEIDTTRGQSGSPIWVTRDGNPWVVGLHIEGVITENRGLRIVAPVMENLRRWKQLGN